MKLTVAHQISAVNSDQWNRLQGADNPFLRYEFLQALEQHHAVAAETGWLPQHLLLWENDQLIAAAPAYLKQHSWGEFVFDFAWAQAYERHGLNYYPKLVICVPFSPVNGPRMLLDPNKPADELRDALALGAMRLTKQLNLSSAHWLFHSAADGKALLRNNYLHRTGCQFHWYNAGYTDFDAFLGGMSAKKRKNIRRERRLVASAGVTMQVIHGHETDTALWSAMHRFYSNTFEAHGNLPLISRECFMDIAQALGEQMILFVAKREETPIAGAICFRDADTLYGRYWGGDEEIDGLHFEACYYQGIEYCIQHGLTHFEPGAQGEHKIARGFLPTLTHSAHCLVDPQFRQAVDHFLERERPAVAGYAEALRAEAPFRSEILDTLP